MCFRDVSYKCTPINRVVTQRVYEHILTIVAMLPFTRELTDMVPIITCNTHVILPVTYSSHVNHESAKRLTCPLQRPLCRATLH